MIISLFPGESRIAKSPNAFFYDAIYGVNNLGECGSYLSILDFLSPVFCDVGKLKSVT